MTQFSFNDRESYLAYRADWRAQYKALTLEIRANKREQRSETGEATSSLQSKLHYLRLTARRLMAERTAATKFKNEQMVAAIAEAA